MNNYIEYALVNNKKYKINTDFRVALRCNEVAESNVSQEEKALAIIYLLFGDEGLDNPNDWEKLLKIALKYLNVNKDNDKDNETEEANMDFKQDWSYIRTSFFYDYGIDLENTQMHWWKFYELLSGLSEHCILSRIRFVRDFDISQIKDRKEKEKWIKQKKAVALKKKERIKTDEEKELDELFEKQLRGE